MNDVLLIIRHMGKQILEHNINRYPILNWLLLVGYLFIYMNNYNNGLMSLLTLGMA